MHDSELEPASPFEDVVGRAEGTSTVAFNPTGVRSDAGTTRVFASVVTDNTTDAFTTANGGAVQTHQNNAVQGNSGSSSAAPIGPQ